MAHSQARELVRRFTEAGLEDIFQTVVLVN